MIDDKYQWTDTEFNIEFRFSEVYVTI